jgi:hypothetical protein
MQLRPRDAALAGLLETMLLTSWPWEPGLVSPMNACALLALCAIPCALLDYILAHRAECCPWSAWELTVFAREVLIVGTYLNPSLVAALACVYAGASVAQGVAARAFARRAAHVAYCACYGVMLLVLLVQRRGLQGLPALLLSYVPARREYWAHVVTTLGLFYVHCGAFAR